MVLHELRQTDFGHDVIIENQNFEHFSLKYLHHANVDFWSFLPKIVENQNYVIGDKLSFDIAWLSKIWMFVIFRSYIGIFRMPIKWLWHHASIEIQNFGQFSLKYWHHMNVDKLNFFFIAKENLHISCIPDFPSIIKMK